MKTLTLKKSKWICGNGECNPVAGNGLGIGHTRLLNNDGYMCCLGQFAEQLGVSLNDLQDKGSPEMLDKVIPLLTDDKFRNTWFSTDAIGINDNKKTTVDEKIEKLKTLFEKTDYTLIIEE